MLHILQHGLANLQPAAGPVLSLPSLKQSQRAACNVPWPWPALPQAHNASYGWNIIVGEVMETIPTLWSSVRAWARANPGSVAPNNSLPGLVMGDAGEEQWYSGGWI